MRILSCVVMDHCMSTLKDTLRELVLSHYHVGSGLSSGSQMWQAAGALSHGIILLALGFKFLLCGL